MNRKPFELAQLGFVALSPEELVKTNGGAARATRSHPTLKTSGSRLARKS